MVNYLLAKQMPRVRFPAGVSKKRENRGGKRKEEKGGEEKEKRRGKNKNFGEGVE